MLKTYLFESSDFKYKFIKIVCYFNIKNILTRADVFFHNGLEKWKKMPSEKFELNKNHLKIILSGYYDNDVQFNLNENTGTLKIWKKTIKLIPHHPPAALPHSKIIPSEKKTELPLVKGILFDNKKLTTTSPFPDVVQYLAQEYLKPYVNDTSDKIKRFYHGVTHAACATYSVDHAAVIRGEKPYVDRVNKTYHGGIFIELLKKYLPRSYFGIIYELNDNEHLTAEDFFLLKAAVFCHDIKNTAEIFKEEKAHADYFRSVMLSLGFDAKRVEKFANAIINKDSLGKKDLCTMILHDADALEYTRVLLHDQDCKKFDINRLDILKLLKKYIHDDVLIAQVIQDIREIMSSYFYKMEFIYKNASLHEKIEFSSRCYLRAQHILQQAALMEGLDSYFSLQDTDWDDEIYLEEKNYLDPISLYQANSASTFSVIRSQLRSDPAHAADTINRFNNEGIFIRRVSDFIKEIKTLDQNRITLKLHNICREQQLKTYFVNNLKDGKASLLSGFKFRPCTMIGGKWSIKTFQGSHPYPLPGLLVKIHSASVLTTHFYKKNIFSDYISSVYDFARPHRVKNLETFFRFVTKITEQEARRRGELWDNYNRYAGFIAQSHHEILMTYDVDAIIGIVTTESKSSATSAILMRIRLNILTGKNFPFYHYDHFTGLTHLSDDYIFSLATSKVTSVSSGESKEIKAEVENSDLKFQLEKLFFDKIIKLDKKVLELDPDQLTEIRCSLKEYDPSSAHPVTYFFKNKGIAGQATVKTGIPILTQDRDYFDSEGLLPRIALQHQYRQVEVFNSLLLKMKPRMSEMFQIFYPLLIINRDKRSEKYYLDFSFTRRYRDKIDYFLILNFIGYDQKKWKAELVPSDAFTTINIRLSVLQAIDRMVNKMNEHITKLIQEESNSAKATLKLR